MDIVPNRRIISAGTMHDGEARTSVTVATIELSAEGEGTRLSLTDQSAFLDAREDPASRRQGYGTVLANLAAFLQHEYSAS